MKLIIRPEAEADVAAGFHWYEEQLPGLGDEFLAIARAQLDRVLERPAAYRKFTPDCVVA